MFVSLGLPQSLRARLCLYSFCLLGSILTSIFSLLAFFHRPPPETRPAREDVDLVAWFEDVALTGASPEGCCAVCLNEFETGEVIRWLKSCKHCFHWSCVDRWINHGRSTCPLCRYCFSPLGEIVCTYQDIRMTSRRLRQRSYRVQYPNTK